MSLPARLAVLPVLLVLALGLRGAPALAQREPVLVPEVSQSLIEVRQGFTGARLLLYGAVIDPEAGRGGDYDIIVVLKGPTEAVRIREKERIAGMWMYVRKAKYDGLPQFLAVASTLPLSRLDPGLLAMLEITPDTVVRNHATANHAEAFDEAVLRLKARDRLYTLTPQPISFFGETLFKTRIHFPDTMPRGTYVAEVYLIDEGQLIGSQTLPLDAVKTGFEAWISDFAHQQPLTYGAMSIIIGLSFGWLAHRIFRKR